MLIWLNRSFYLGGSSVELGTRTVSYLSFLTLLFVCAQTVSWWWVCQSCVVMSALSSSLSVRSLFNPWTTRRIPALTAVQPSSSTRTLTGPRRPATTMTTASWTPACTSSTCEVDLLILRALTVTRQTVGLTPLTGCRWSLACLPPHLPHLLFSHHTSRRLAACCTPDLSHILADTNQALHFVTGFTERGFGSWTGCVGCGFNINSYLKPPSRNECFNLYFQALIS